MPEEGLREVVSVAKQSGLAEKLSGRTLCDHCLGRLFGKISTGLNNPERGRAIRESLNLDGAKECWLCEGLFEEIEKFSQIVEEEMKEIEFESFLIGSRIDPEIRSREESLWIELGLEDFEIAKSEINREVGKILENKLEEVVDFENPDVVAVINTMFDDVEFNINPIFVYGRYRKHSREVPQTTWTCHSCWGKGCEECNNTGKAYQTSVAMIIGEPLKEESGSEDYSFHGSGREDVDVQMLGNGRPFVLELSRPRRRTIDFKEVQRKINRSKMVEVTELRPSDRKEMVRTKNARFPKSYEAIVDFDEPVSVQKLKEVVRSFHGKEIAQQTPRRVARRRADRTRKRTIHDFQASLLDDGSAELRIKAEAGTYIKELVDGDEGRTRPNLRDMLGVDCRVKYLDVVDIHDEDDDDGENL